MTITVDPRRDDPQDVVDALTYANYKHNRLHAPRVQPSRWAGVIGETWRALERRYRTEPEAREMCTITARCPCGAERLLDVPQFDVADVLALGSWCKTCARQHQRAAIS